eukprot:522568_1
MDDALNGYMFGLSYHILAENNISTYFYHNAGGTIFELSDAKKGWPQWFDKVNGKPQKCEKLTSWLQAWSSRFSRTEFKTTTTGDRIDMTCNKDRLTNVHFGEFKKQYKDL